MAFAFPVNAGIAVGFAAAFVWGRAQVHGVAAMKAIEIRIAIRRSGERFLPSILSFIRSGSAYSATPIGLLPH